MKPMPIIDVDADIRVRMLRGVVLVCRWGRWLGWARHHSRYLWHPIAKSRTDLTGDR